MQKNLYELTYIINAVLSDDQTKEQIARVNKLIEDSGGAVKDVDDWGSQRLSYPIRKKRNGYFVNLVFEAAGDTVPRLERALQINDNILRYLTLKMDRKMVHHRDVKKTEAERAAEAAA